MTPGAVLGGSADDNLVPKMQVELANVVLVEAALVVEVDAEGLGRVLARAWTALQLTVTANLLPSMLLLAGWGGVGRQEQQREVVAAALLLERRASNSKYLGETKLQATSGGSGREWTATSAGPKC